MQKLKLDLNALQVNSFDAGSADAVRGTVAANEQTITTTPIGTTSLLTPTLLPAPEDQQKLGAA